MTKGSYNPETHTYTRQGQVLVSVTDALKEADLVQVWGKPFHLSRGRATHASLAYALADDLNWSSVDPVVLPYLHAGLKCIRDLKPDLIIAIEQGLSHPTLPVAGTPDLVLRRRGVRLLLDFQSGGMDDAKGLQTALYEWLGGVPCQRWGVQLLQNEQYRLHPFRDRSDKAVGLTAIYKALDARGVNPTAIFGVRLTDKQVDHVLTTWKRTHGFRDLRTYRSTT